MRAAWYEKPGPAREVLVVGEIPDPEPGPNELRIRVAFSGVNPGDVKKRRDAFGYGMPYSRIIPHSDGAGEVDRVGDKVSADWLDRRVWCFGAQTHRPFGTAAEYTVVPAMNAVLLPDNASMEQGACLGIPGITAHRAVHAAGPVASRTVLVRGAAGAVGLCAVQLAHRAGARVIAAIGSASGEAAVRRAGAHEVVAGSGNVLERVRALAPGGVNHIVEATFGANIDIDIELAAPGGSIATYATDVGNPRIPYWPLAFKNVSLFFLGSDDFSDYMKVAAARDLNAALKAGWQGFEIAEAVPLPEIARAHELVDDPARRGRVLVIP